MNNTEEYDLNEEEVEYLMLKYLLVQTNKGRPYVETKELYEYMGSELPNDMENEKITLSPSAKRFIKDFEQKNRPYLH